MLVMHKRHKRSPLRCKSIEWY